MPQTIKDVINNVKEVYITDSSLATLLDFERVLSELDLYVFKNWKFGELVAGPVYEKYFVTCTFMWPYKKMPDPRGGERLLDYGCEVRFKKDLLEYPAKIKSPDDFKPGTKVPRLKTTPIWLVEIVMPRSLMTDIFRGSVELEAGTVDAEDVQQAYETGMDDEMYQDEGEGGDTGAVPNVGKTA